MDGHRLRNPELRNPGGLVPAWTRRRLGTATSSYTDIRTPHANAHADDALPDAYAHDALPDAHTGHPVANAHNPIPDPNATAGITHTKRHQHATLTATCPATGNASATRSGLPIRGGGLRNRRTWRANPRRHSAH